MLAERRRATNRALLADKLPSCLWGSVLTG
jgi:hypothetical protein